MKLSKTILYLLLPILLPNLAAAESPEQRGHAIAVEAEKRDTGFGNYTVELEMILTNRAGDEAKRQILSRVLEVNGDGDKSLTLFNEPADLKGTAFLSFTHALKPDEQWLYLPALKRVKRIASGNKSGPFMGSEFAYEDLSSQEVEKYRYKYLRDETINGKPAFVVERYPNYEHSGYTRMVTWIDQAHYIPLKIEFYDRKNTLLKTLLFKQYKQHLGQYWRAQEMDMENHTNGKRTKLYFRDYAFRVGLTEKDFNRNTLKRAR